MCVVDCPRRKKSAGRWIVRPMDILHAIGNIDPHFINNMVLALDNYFVYRARAIEKKDGNPPNEVRMLCNSIMNNTNKMCADTTIKYDPAKSVLKCQVGDEIKFNEADFMRLTSFFFAEIESRYL